MGDYSYLETKSWELMEKGSIPVGWFLLFDSKDLCTEGTDEDSEEDFFIGYKTTILNAKKNLQARLNQIKYPYLKELFKPMSKLKELLNKLPDKEIITLNMSDFGAYDPDSKEMMDDLKTLPKRMENAIKSKSYAEFDELNEMYGTPNLNISGDFEEDLQNINNVIEGGIEQLIIGHKAE